jgi:prepilin-type processing-associated H-X9-DG protein
MYPDYWNDPEIAICPSDPRVVLRGRDIPEDYSATVQEVSGNDQDAVTACRAALLSYPISYPYIGWATDDMLSLTDAIRFHQLTYFVEGELDWPELGDTIEVPIRKFEQAQLEAIDCPVKSTGNGQANRVWHVDFDQDIPGNSHWGTELAAAGPIPDSYPRLKEGVERFFITDINNPAGGAQAQSTIAVMWDAWGTSIEQAPWESTVNIDQGVLKSNHVPGGSNVLYMDGHVEFVRLNSRYPVTTEFGVEPDLTDRTNPVFLVTLTMTRSGGDG